MGNLTIDLKENYIFHTVFLILAEFNSDWHLETGSFSLLNAKSAVGLWWTLRDPNRDHSLRPQDPSIARSATVGRPRMNTSLGTLILTFKGQQLKEKKESALAYNHLRFLQ